MPLKAADLHRDNIERVTQMALERSGRSLDEVGGIAVTVGPGMKPSLHEGIQFARKLAQESKFVNTVEQGLNIKFPPSNAIYRNSLFF